KAMIFTWLRLQGRLDEKTRVYGYTRSWSKLGSAFSIIIATLFVIFTKNYSSVFHLSIVPYVFGLVNFLYYPVELEGPVRERVALSDILEHLWTTLRDSMRIRHLRRLIVESMAFEGVFEAVKDYLQPVIKAMALTIPLFVYMENTRRGAIIVGMVYFALHLLSAWGSRMSHRITQHAGGEERGAYRIWKVALIIYCVLATLLYLQWYYAAIVGFVALYGIQNLWRPILISRFDGYATETHGATVLSVESQAKSLSTIATAPLLGIAVDGMKQHVFGGEFWPVGAVGAVLACIMLVTFPAHRRQ
ncbi:MAG TPA: hypothetical protein PLA74_07635, partial [Syntrophales bacterium]|nr:hypothetical protein [Syntrophales bacterium]